ncbi:hypothetical protein [Streptomyces olivaceus]|uniref:hypothetical protein n=1 Tax=Streptomyces olivaceus TaxID=47716 RepID=UPI004056188B
MTGAGEWWDRAVEASLWLLAVRPAPEGIRVVALVLSDCPPERAAGLQRRARSALGPALPPSALASASEEELLVLADAVGPLEAGA